MGNFLSCFSVKRPVCKKCGKVGEDSWFAMTSRQRARWVVTVEGACCKACVVEQYKEQWTPHKSWRRQVTPSSAHIIGTAVVPSVGSYQSSGSSAMPDGSYHGGGSFTTERSYHGTRGGMLAAALAGPDPQMAMLQPHTPPTTAPAAAALPQAPGPTSTIFAADLSARSLSADSTGSSSCSRSTGSTSFPRWNSTGAIGMLQAGAGGGLGRSRRHSDSYLSVQSMHAGANLGDLPQQQQQVQRQQSMPVPLQPPMGAGPRSQRQAVLWEEEYSQGPQLSSSLENWVGGYAVKYSLMTGGRRRR